MKSLKGSETANNLIDAFRDKTHNHQLYSTYAAIATEEGYMAIADMLNLYAKNENEHARLIARFLICSNFASNEICSMDQIPISCSNTINNLRTLAKNEAISTMVTYPEYIQIAYNEKYLEVAIMFNMIKNADENHGKQCASTAGMLENDTYFKKNEVKKWICNRCGYIYNGYEAPSICPLCTMNQRYFEIQCKE